MPFSQQLTATAERQHKGHAQRRARDPLAAPPGTGQGNETEHEAAPEKAVVDGLE